VKEFTLQTELRLSSPRDEVFSFFAGAHNLQTIMPSWLKFEVLTPATIVMRPGTLIDYRITVYGLPIRWRREIAQWHPPHQLVDVQLHGPYTLWHQREGQLQDANQVSQSVRQPIRFEFLDNVRVANHPHEETDAATSACNKIVKGCMTGSYDFPE
jgi:ligand-binding SRPBCC domain-containing protein